MFCVVILLLYICCFLDHNFLNYSGTKKFYYYFRMELLIYLLSRVQEGFETHKYTQIQ